MFIGTRKKRCVQGEFCLENEYCKDHGSVFGSLNKLRNINKPESRNKLFKNSQKRHTVSTPHKKVEIMVPINPCEENFLASKKEDLQNEGQNQFLLEINEKLKLYYDEGIRIRNMGEPEVSLKYFNAMIRIAPNNITGFNSRGYTYLSLGKFVKALKDFNYCLRFDQNNTKILLNRAKCYLHLKKIKLALIDYQKILSLDKYECRAWNGRGVCLKKLGYLNKALECFNKAIEEGKEEFKKEAIINRAFTFFSLDRFIESLRDFNRLIEEYKCDELKVMREKIGSRLKSQMFFENDFMLME